jgi:hypothetical protein
MSWILLFLYFGIEIIFGSAQGGKYFLWQISIR